MLYLIILLLGFVGLFFIGEMPAFMNQFAAFSAGFLPLSLLIGYFNIAGMIAGNIYIHRVFTVFRDTVLDTTESIESLEDFERWLSAVCNRNLHLIFSVIGSVLVGIYLISVLYDTGITISSSTIIGTILLNTFSIAFLYLLIYMVILSARIGRYTLKLYTSHPANSEVINCLASLLSSFVYLVSAYATLLTLGVALQRFLIPFGVTVVLLFWMPIVGMFILNQSSLSSIIRRAKWKTLNEIAARVEKLHISEKLGEKDTMESINRLMDYHDRVKATRNSAVDLGSTLKFINSLLLPLLAFILGNLDLVTNLFTKRP